MAHCMCKYQITSVNLLKMAVLKYGWLFLCTWLTLCAALPHAPAHSRSKRRAQREQIRLDFRLFSNSMPNCSAGLSNEGVNVAVSYRTSTDSASSRWIPIPWPPIFSEPDATSCSTSHSLELTVDIGNASDIQFRFVQEEHAGGSCNCWAVDDLVLRNGPVNATLGDISCSTETTADTLTDCPNTKSSSVVLCGGSASVPRGVVTRVYSRGGDVSDAGCRGGQLVDNVGPSPVCTSDSPDTPYISISFQLNMFHNRSGDDCNDLDNLDEGVELSIGNSSGDGRWVPLVFYSATDLDERINNSIRLGDVTNSSLLLRGYSVPVERVTADTTQSIRTVLICDSEFLEAGVQFRWLQTSTVQFDLLPGKDVWTLGNVTVVVRNDTVRQVLSEGFDLNNFRVKAGRVANNTCGLSGQSLAFGLDPAIGRFEGRIGVTPPLDLRPDVGSVEPTSEGSLPTTVEVPLSPGSSALDQSAQELINGDAVYSGIQRLPPTEAIKRLAALTPPVNETVVVYLMADILDRIATDNVSTEFSMDFTLAASNILERVKAIRDREESSTMTIAGSSLLRVMDRFALQFFSAINSTGSLETDNIDVDVQKQNGSGPGEEFKGLDRDDSQTVIPRELIRNLEIILTRAQVASYRYDNMSGLLPASLPGMDSNGTNATILASPILSTALQCETGICDTRSMTLQRPVRIVIAHPENVQEMVDRPDSEIICVFWEFDNSSGRLVGGNWAVDGCYRNENLSNTTATVCECNHLTHFAILLSPGPVADNPAVRLSLEIIGAVGVSISLVAMVITIATFICLKSLWSMRNYIHINLCISLIVAQVTFVAGVEPRGSVVGCQVVAVLLHYFFLVTFMWMLMEGVVLYVALVRVFVKHQARYIVAFTVASYGLPLLYMCVTIPLGFALDNGPHYGNEQACWLRYDTYFIWAFNVPVIVIILANIGFFIMAITIMYRHHRQQVHKSNAAEARYWARSSISLLVVMGITWIIGIATFGTEALLPIAYIFTIFVAFQGLAIFILFVVLSKQVRDAYRKWWKVKVAESEFLSKHFGEKLPTTSNPNTVPLVPVRAGTTSPYDDCKREVPSSNCGLEEQGKTAVDNSNQEEIPSSNGGLEKPEKTAVDNDYQDPSQLQSGKEPKPDSEEITAL